MNSPELHEHVDKLSRLPTFKVRTKNLCIVSHNILPELFTVNTIMVLGGEWCEARRSA